MRRAFIHELTAIAAEDQRVVLLTGDLGYSVLEPFAEAHPDRFFNAGVAEQNMIAVATGLAEAGMIPFVYSIATFATLRGFEFIRNGPVRHRVPVRIVGAGGGFEYGPAGASHHATEDIGAMRLLGDVEIIAPADANQCRSALRATWDSTSVLYYRLGRDESYQLPAAVKAYRHGYAQVLRTGEDILLVTIGPLAREVLEAADILAKQGVLAKVALVQNLAPLPQNLVDLLGQHSRVMTIEDHVQPGGLGAAVAEVICQQKRPCQLEQAHTIPGFPERVGSCGYCLSQVGLDADGVVGRVHKFMEKTS